MIDSENIGKGEEWQYLASVGGWVNILTQCVHPSFEDETPDFENPTHLDDVEEEWLNALSPSDEEILIITYHG